MQFYSAEISDILRCTQRDANFINELQEYTADTARLLWGNKFHSIRKYIPIFTNSLYYLLTSASHLQTLGEEYTGVVRLDRNNQIPARYKQLIWLILYVGGDKLYEAFLKHLNKKVHFNASLTPQAKSHFAKIIEFLKENKYLLLRFHLSLFYIYGKYQNIANRLTGIKYVLLRQWMQDKTAMYSFNMLGKFSLIYLTVAFIEELYTQKTNYIISNEAIIASTSSKSSEICVLCQENCKNVSVTPCGHLYCWECIYNSLQHSADCPTCREDVNPSRIVLLQNYA